LVVGSNPARGAGKTLELVCKIWKEENRGKSDHGGEVGGTFFIAIGDAPKLLEMIDESFDDIPLSVVLFVE
jgi:hypothetical protein